MTNLHQFWSGVHLYTHSAWFWLNKLPQVLALGALVRCIHPEMHTVAGLPVELVASF